MNSEQFQHYLELRYNPNTVRQYLWAYRSFSDGLQNQEDVDNFLIEKVYSKSNNPFYKGFLKAYIDCFFLDEKGNPIFNITKSKRKNISLMKKKDYKFLTKEEVDYIIGRTSPRISLLVRLFFDSGLRLRELIYARREDISLTSRTIKGTGKGNKPFSVRFSPKTTRLLEVFLADNELEHPFWTSNEKRKTMQGASTISSRRNVMVWA